MTHGTHWLRSTGLALLALVVLSGGSFAAGDLFDDTYHDCPAKVRLRDGQIADLTLARDAEEETEVNVAWAVTDPATWGLGANAYSAALVVLLDDGVNDLQAKTVSLGTRKQTFSGVQTGTEVKVQMAIVVDTAEGDYLISDILEATVNQSLTAPSFSTGWSIKGIHPLYEPHRPGWQNYPLPDLGMLYYIGYNANFGNYRAGEGLTFTTEPTTPRFRIGLAHGGEDNDAREDVKFDAYVIRLIGEDGDIIPEGDDVRTMVSDYGQSYSQINHPQLGFLSGSFDNQLVLNFDPRMVYAAGSSELFIPTTFPVVTPEQAAQSRASLVAAGPLVNVRINDGGTMTPPMYQSDILRAVVARDASVVRYSPAGKTVGIKINFPNGNDIFALAPDEHRDFPIDVLASDRTYTIEAWAVNEDGEVLSPKATLKVHPREQAPTTLSSGEIFRDYLTAATAVRSGMLLTTEFTVLK